MGEVVLEATEMANPVPAGNGARVLIVDDSKTNLLKMGLFVKAPWTRGALQTGRIIGARNTRPGKYRHHVARHRHARHVRLRCPKGNEIERPLRDIPVIVISSLDDDMDSVVRAIELGADDFLPKDFNPVLLKARASAGVERKRLRDLELEYLGESTG